MFIRTGTWQSTNGYAAAAKSPHEAQMARCLGNWRGLVQNSLFIFIPIKGELQNKFHKSRYFVKSFTHVIPVPGT